MFELEDHHWWFQGRLAMIEGWWERYIRPAHAAAPPRLLDLGCGTGMFLSRRKADADPIGVDFSREALRFCTSRRLRPVLQADAQRLPFASGSFDVVTAFDLIEHVPDDARMLGEIHRVLRPGGHLLATVPAHPFLWTGHDVSLHHHRRYTRHAFEALFEPGAWQTVRMTGAFGLVFAPAAAVRLARRLSGQGLTPRSDTRPLPEWINRPLLALHRAEAAWLRRGNLPTGISLMTLRRKLG